MAELTFDLTPDPKILVALTHTPLSPIDALCELVDNAVDSFRTAELRGEPVEYPLVIVDVPGPAEVSRGEGRVLAQDNGPGLSAGDAEKALRAGYSGNRAYDSLGLFGMGFNIATGKLGERTRFVTARAADDYAVEVVIDLPRMQDEGTYRVPVERIPKPEGVTHGTVVEVSRWWPQGNANHDFARNLAGYSKQTLLKQLGRRYATLIRDQRFRLRVRGEVCEAFEHCTWGKDRYVMRKVHGKIPARVDIHQVIGSQTRCNNCNTLLVAGHDECPSCHSKALRTIHEQLRGWLGVQRFDDLTDFGVDLIRNGRAIALGEKTAFFDYVDEFKEVTHDYPVDSTFGRIVGEIHLDHVPVDFLKQDFQRTSDEWLRAVRFLRGDSSLQPTKPRASPNDSPMYMLYQGYRRAKTAGTTDMYMGYWDKTERKPKRVSRDVERDYYAKFLQKLPGFDDDVEWWKLVDAADQEPPEELVECPNCHAENLKADEVCQACGAVLNGRNCVNGECGKLVPISAVSCSFCGTSQIPDIKEPWHCSVCKEANDADAQACRRCSSGRAELARGSREYLIQHSNKDDDLSVSGLTVPLADGKYCDPLNVEGFTTTGPIVPVWDGPGVPLLLFKEQPMQAFVDTNHPIFVSYRLRPEELLAAEIAQYLYDYNRHLLNPQGFGIHTLSQLTWQVLAERWGDDLEDSPERVKTDAQQLFAAMLERLSTQVGERASDFYGDLTDAQQRRLATAIIASGYDVSKLGEWRSTGEYLRFVDPTVVVQMLRSAPEIFFDGGIWQVSYTSISGLSGSVLADIQYDIKSKYLNCLEDCVSFAERPATDPLTVGRARASVAFLNQKLA